MRYESGSALRLSPRCSQVPVGGSLFSPMSRHLGGPRPRPDSNPVPSSIRLLAGCWLARTPRHSSTFNWLANAESLFTTAWLKLVLVGPLSLVHQPGGKL